MPIKVARQQLCCADGIVESKTPSPRAAGMHHLQLAGSPSQRGLEMDAEAALKHVLARLDVDANRIILYGKSLGGAVALHTASKHESLIRAAVVENSFLSVPEMVPRLFPFLSFAFGQNGFLNFLVTNKWQNRDCVRQVKSTPLLLIASKQVSPAFNSMAVMHSCGLDTSRVRVLMSLTVASEPDMQDELVPFEHMERMKELAVTKYKMWTECPQSGHMDAYEVDSVLYWHALKDFWTQYVQA